MNVSKVLFIFLLNFILIISSVNAIGLSSQVNNLELCPRESGLLTNVVRNDGDVAKNYEIQLSGSASSWAVSTQNNFILASGEEKSVYVYVTPSNAAELGNYNLNFAVKSQDESKSLLHVIRVKDCYGVSLYSNLAEQTSCPSDVISYKVGILNRGQFQDTFRLSLSGELTENSRLSQETVALNPGETKEITIFVNSPVESGNYDLILSANSSRENADLELRLIVDSCYNYLLTVSRESSDFSVCEHNVVTIPFNLRNQGTVSNTFNLNIEDGPAWIRLNENQLNLNQNEARTFILALAPDFGTTGNYSISLSAVPERGNIKATADINVEVRKCHSVDINLFLDKDIVCKGVRSDYSASIKNNGEITKNYELSLEAPNWIRLLGDNTYSLRAGESRNITFTAEPSEDIETKDYDITIRATATDISKASAEDVINLDVKNSDECFSPLLNTNYENVVVYSDSNILIPVKIVNDGLRVTNFKFGLSGEASDFSRLPNDEVRLNPGENSTLYVYVAPNANTELKQYSLDLETYADGSLFLESKRFNIEVTDQAERATVIDGDAVLENGNGFINFLSKNKNLILFALAILLIVILVLIFGRKAMDFFDEDEEKPKRKRKSAKEVENIKEKVEE